MREFYDNINAIKLSTPEMRIRGKMVNFRVEQINRVYGLLHANRSLFSIKDCTMGSYLVLRVCSNINVPWETKKVGITSNELKIEARI